MIIEALKPARARARSCSTSKTHRILLKVATDDLAIAIGRKGQNARLTSRLIGWRLDIEEFKADGDDPRGNAVASLVKAFSLGCRRSPAAWSTWASIRPPRSRASRPTTWWTPVSRAEEAADIIGRVTAR